MSYNQQDGETLGALSAGERLFVAPQPLNPATKLPFIQKLFIANRGEICCRIISTCQKLMIKTVVAYVREDEQLLHVQNADEAIDLGRIEDHKVNPFLNIDLLIQTALNAGAQAIHPGYGYLSENADFADRVRQRGLIFVGPSASAMSTLGDKRRAKDYLAEKAPEVPLVPGVQQQNSTDLSDLAAAANQIGYPVMLKASAGGGGKGMRVVHEAANLAEELARVQSEAARSFGSADCILEKFVENSKHVEVQIVGDGHGHVVSFGERDCSVQRRHQKIIEETPCQFLSPEVRQKMAETAVTIARLIGYDNAGTVEFVLDADTSAFYFLEVNARLQVEHPISEEVSGVDLVALQLFVAAGGSLATLPRLQNIQPSGHAIECRLCAEDPAHDFMPQHGPVHLWQPGEITLPGSLNTTIRYETALRSGASVSIHFDPMVAKIVVWAPSRQSAVQRMELALSRLACIGVQTNQLFLQRCLKHPAFQDPRYTTSLIPQNLDQLLLKQPTEPLAKIAETIIPSLFIRGLQNAHNLKQAAATSVRRPFSEVRLTFRNQRHDPVSIHSDIINSSLCIWQSALPTERMQTGEVSIFDIPQVVESGLSAADRYNRISKMLRRRKTGTHQPIVFRLHTFEVAPSSSSSTHSLSTVVEISLDGVRFMAHCVAPSESADHLNQSQEIPCHFPHLGDWQYVQRHTLLSYAESCRQQDNAENGATGGEIKAPMPCKILSIQKSDGDQVVAGDTLLVIESMKMEVSIKASTDGTFKTSWKDGDFVSEGKVLCKVE